MAGVSRRMFTVSLGDLPDGLVVVPDLDGPAGTRYPVIDVDKMPAPYRHNRLLTSTRRQESPHPSVVKDTKYEEVWAYLLEEGVE